MLLVAACRESSGSLGMDEEGKPNLNRRESRQTIVRIPDGQRRPVSVEHTGRPTMMRGKSCLNCEAKILHLIHRVYSNKQRSRQKLKEKDIQLFKFSNVSTNINQNF